MKLCKTFQKVELELRAEIVRTRLRMIPSVLVILDTTILKVGDTDTDTGHFPSRSLPLVTVT